MPNIAAGLKRSRLLATFAAGDLIEPCWIESYFPMQKVPKMQSLMFIGVSGNAPFSGDILETYIPHVPLALAGGNSLKIPHSAPMNCGCYVVAEQRHQMLQFWANYVAELATEENVMINDLQRAG